MANKEDIIVKCIHHWSIDIATGPRSLGTCVKCNKLKTFKNSITTDSLWTNKHIRVED